MYQRKRLPEGEDKALHISIIDFRDSAMNVAIIKFWQGTVEVKGFCYDDHLGSSHFTICLVTWLLAETQK
jgi:molecular chaperone DnaK (HSP70)